MGAVAAREAVPALSATPRRSGFPNSTLPGVAMIGRGPMVRAPIGCSGPEGWVRGTESGLQPSNGKPLRRGWHI